jgi:cell division protein FtsL
VTALADDLRRYLRNEPINARPDTFAYRAAKFVRRNRLAVSLGTLAIVATAAGIVGTMIQTRTARAQRDLALQQLQRRQAVSEFNEFLLSDAAPSGKPFTVWVLLVGGRHLLLFLKFAVVLRPRLGHEKAEPTSFGDCENLKHIRSRKGVS